MKKTSHTLYWEDTEETLLFAELDDYAWKLPEKIFDYEKSSSLYIYHDRKLAAFYHPDDTKREAAAGYAFYSSDDKADRVIRLKEQVAEKVRVRLQSLNDTDSKHLSDSDLHQLIMEVVDLYEEALSTHYLTQPQFFEAFEQKGQSAEQGKLEEVAAARLKYTRIAWTSAMRFAKRLLVEFALRQDISPDEAESLTYEELRDTRIDSAELKWRSQRYVMKSDFHNIEIITGPAVDEYIQTYENFSGIDNVRGIVGNRGTVQGSAFVVANENLNLRDLPKGMKKGMVLIIQNAWPEFEPYYEMASAIVTNEGGITSHGVVVAREFGIPCIVGTRIATHIFRTGDMVEVDADKGIVRKI